LAAQNSQNTSSIDSTKESPNNGNGESTSK
jgi:hypothetical protein